MPPAGRPRTFDREEALKKAMLVFWEKGFEGTTMADLIAAIGMKAPSVYAAFGNKDTLFREVVELYKNKVEQGPLKALNETTSILNALENSLNESVKMVSGPEASSCLIMAGAINCAPEHQEHVQHLRNLRAMYKETLKKRFMRAIKDGQLIEGAEPDALAEFYFGFIHGLALRAKDGSTKRELHSSCKFALEALRSVLRDSNVQH
ncbi:MAG: TetR/AcrR family transcriptional regulator [Methylophilaceae bacterium]|jgi:AcrR family transcriptional regulator|uniref:TetR/AcrR family transcriptional regulator n=1 Tax=Methylobacillus sp. MM3 TaxID=1848039 RepID=UPI0007DF422E|nr:TetR/AcrR family transcriptional regulator [Methylobacillus sp. MM3]OAJ69446.1 TetR family transcriptional regulator [Methylobacillus sp. MM3]